MKTPSLKTLLRVIGVLLLPWSGLFILFSVLGTMTKAHDPTISSLLFGLLLLAIAVYFLFGAPHLVRAMERRH